MLWKTKVYNLILKRGNVCMYVCLSRKLFEQFSVFEILEYWDNGIFRYWDIAILRYCNIEIIEYRNKIIKRDQNIDIIEY